MTPDKRCSISDCGKPHEARGWCDTHYARWRATGSVQLGLRKRIYPRKPMAERFWPKVQKTDDCWLWIGTKTKAGYGRLSLGGRSGMVLAHRVSWELANGPIPSGLQIDHLCRRPSCVNPAHLEPVTVAENTRRGYAPSVGAAHNLAKTHCPRNHPYDEANTQVNRRGGRCCRACSRERASQRRLKAKEGAIRASDPGDT